MIQRDMTCHRFYLPFCLSDHRCLFAADHTETRRIAWNPFSFVIQKFEVAEVSENAGGALLCGDRRRKKNVHRVLLNFKKKIAVELFMLVNGIYFLNFTCVFSTDERR